MHPFLQIILLATAAVSAGALVVSVIQQQRFFTFLQTGKLRVLVSFPRTHSGSGHHHSPSPSGYAIYSYRNGKWVMEADLSLPGYEATPPSRPGAFEGHVVKKESITKLGH